MKAEFRKQIQLKRDSIPPDLRKTKEAAIRKRLYGLREFRNADTILLFASFRSEVDTRAILRHILKLGKRLILPRVDPHLRQLRLYEVRDTQALSPGYMGIAEPPAQTGREVQLRDVHLAIVPGLAFDASGNRLGYGGGYYDRLLAAAAHQRDPVVTISFCFEEQITEALPSEPHDIKIDMIITDKRLIRCKGRRRT